MDLDLSKKRAVVCGASQGIGHACAVELASLGAAVTLMARDEAALSRACDKLPDEHNQTHSALVADFSDPETVSGAIDAFVDETGGADILINNTGGPPGGTAIDAHPDEYLSAFRMHLVCNQILAQALTPGMKERRWGRIVNVISTSVKSPIPGLGVSNTVRGAVASWAKTISAELAPHGITVNSVLPGFTETSRLQSLIKAKATKQDSTPDSVAKAMRASVPAGRFGAPEEIAAAVAFLCSPAASYVNGVSLPVDGGRTNVI